MLPPSLVYFQLANEKARAAALETDMQQRVREAVTAGERRDRELRIKEAMLEDQNDSIKKLKASLASLQELQSVTERGLNDTIQELMVRRRVYACSCRWLLAVSSPRWGSHTPLDACVTGGLSSVRCGSAT